jgi:hypothetical protein
MDDRERSHSAWERSHRADPMAPHALAATIVGHEFRRISRDHHD